MSPPELKIPAETLEQQGKASNPHHSAWVSANAGSGKTHVLAERVVRLLLQGTDPSRILCLTFTKAAAGEMANRVFKTLGEWAVMDDETLSSALTKVERTTPKPALLLHARTLFARALETPGGLKIQTIHAFCEALLHQFPLEANIPGNFTVMDESAQRLLMEQARRSVVLAAETGSNTASSNAFARLLAFATDHAIDKVMDELVARRETILPWLDAVGGADEAVSAARDGLGFGGQETVPDLQTSLCSSFEMTDDRWLSIQNTAIESGAKLEVQLAEKISVLLSADGNEARLEALKSILLTGGKPRKFGTYPSKYIEAELPGTRECMETDADRLIKGLARINTLIQIEESEPLFEIAEAMLRTYRNLKRARGLLDYDDLIARTDDLLERSNARSWVLYKMDRGIDHILLDEAQDTSPQQWHIVDQLVEEFFAGKSARDFRRTAFAVGDEKQSIYSFQGARPQSFSEQKRRYAKLIAGADQKLETANLNLSFRSTPDVLGVVDRVFGIEQHRKGLTFGGDYQDHVAQRRNDPGSVELWQKIASDRDEPPEHWHEVQDARSNPHPALQLADLVAARVDRWIEQGDLIHTKDGSRPIRAGDILVLVRSRDRFITALTRALKDRNIPVAGADRLSLTDHIAVQDLIALGRVMLTPQDDLSLAALLKSPLLGLDEDALFDLAHGRKGTLLEALAARKDEAPYRHAYEKITRWFSRAGHMPVYEFYARILGDDRGRRDFAARLGAEAEDVLDAFLALTLDREQSGLPGLHAFIEDLLMEEPEIKREFAEQQNEVRVMTVHAAKGLEAPVVFLVDKSSKAMSDQHGPALFEWGEEDADPTQRGFLWVPSTADHGDVSLRSKERVKELAEEEYRRLLYVGMTRAEDRLIVCGYKSSKSVPDPNWHDMVATALDGELEDLESLADGIVAQRWKTDARQPDPVDQKEAAERLNDEEDASSLPGWLHHRLPKERALPRPLNPSGAQALIDESLVKETVFPSLLLNKDEEAPASARKRGTVIHRLLQVWPDLDPAIRQEQSIGYVSHALPDLADHAVAAMVGELESIINSPALAPYLDPKTSRAEVPIMGRVDLASGPRLVSGTIDRMAVLDDRVMLLDYKTSRHVPEGEAEIPKDHFTQMALYRALTTRLYPEKTVDAALVWTHAKGGPKVIHLDNTALDRAFAELAAL